MRKKNKLVYGVGINDFDGDVVMNGKQIKSYKIWKSMLQRCYSSKSQLKHPTYIGCSVCDEWLIFSNFKKWFDEHYIEGFHIDKDLLVEGNNMYSPVTCTFVPQYINKILNDCENARGDLPIGITTQRPNIKNRQINTTYRAQCSYTFDGESTRLSRTFKTVEEASTWYSVTKAMVVREVAQYALDRGDIEKNVFDAVVSRKF